MRGRWVQIVNQNAVAILDATSGVGTVHSCTTPSPGLPALDGNYPYGIPGATMFGVTRPNDTATDGPYAALVNTGSPTRYEVKRTFQATMYLMWDPTLPSGCAAAHNTGSTVQSPGSVASNCSSIPVPIASTLWYHNGDAINTLAYAGGGVNWVAPCAPGSANACVVVQPGSDPRTSFPTWSKSTNGGVTCTP